MSLICPGSNSTESTGSPFSSSEGIQTFHPNQDPRLKEIAKKTFNQTFPPCLVKGSRFSPLVCTRFSVRKSGEVQRKLCRIEPNFLCYIHSPRMFLNWRGEMTSKAPEGSFKQARSVTIIERNPETHEQKMDSESYIFFKSKKKGVSLETGNRLITKEALILANYSGQKGIIQICNSISYANKYGELRTGLILKRYNFDLTFMLEKKLITEENRWIIIDHIISGLSSIHEKGGIHRDIKPSNILIKQDVLGGEIRDVVIGDFGTYIDIHDEEGKNFIEGSPFFFAPEYLLAQQKKDYRKEATTQALDVWATGMVLYLMRQPSDRLPDDLFHRVSFFVDRDRKLSLRNGKPYHPFFENKLPPENLYARLVWGMLRPQIKDRWSMPEVQKHWVNMRPPEEENFLDRPSNPQVIVYPMNPFLRNSQQRSLSSEDKRLTPPSVRTEAVDTSCGCC